MIWLPSRLLSRSAEMLSEEHLVQVHEDGLDVLRRILGHGEMNRSARMFQYNPSWLLAYVGTINIELGVRFNRDPSSGYHMACRHFMRLGISLAATPPDWLGNKAFHLAQRSYLIGLDPEYYAHRMPLNTPLDLPLVWPKGT